MNSNLVQMSNSEMQVLQDQLIAEQFKRLKSSMEKMEDKTIKNEEEIKTLNTGLGEVEREIKNMPLLNMDCKQLQLEVRKKGVYVLGGTKSPAYKDHSIRGSVYADIQVQLRREFGVIRYEQIKRTQLDQAIEIVKEYRVPIVLAERIDLCNRQVQIE